MSEVWIYVFLNDRSRHLAWSLGEVNWPGAPHPGDTWFHCGDWAGEEFDRVSFYGPENGKTRLDIEVRTTSEVLAHLIADHGFEHEDDEDEPMIEVIPRESSG